jgi:hypothetical protein
MQVAIEIGTNLVSEERVLYGRFVEKFETTESIGYKVVFAFDVSEIGTILLNIHLPSHDSV